MTTNPDPLFIPTGGTIRKGRTMNDHAEWLTRTTNRSQRKVAATIGIDSAQLNREIRRGLDADRVIQIATAYYADPVQALRDTGHLPAPKPRTLADMTAAEQEACRWMQAKVFHSASTVACVVDPGDFRSTILFQDGAASNVDNDQITPLPGLPRMVWPGEHVAVGVDVSIIPPKIDTSTRYDDDVDMTPEDVPAGEVWIVECYGDRHVGTRDSKESPHWALARMDGTDVTFAGDHLVTLVSRLVPEEEQA